MSGLLFWYALMIILLMVASILTTIMLIIEYWDFLEDQYILWPLIAIAILVPALAIVGIVSEMLKL